jgi:peptidoglycan/LPS O-acetylase OafA/YrhL
LWKCCTWGGLVGFFAALPALATVPGVAGGGAAIGAAVFVAGLNFGESGTIHKVLERRAPRFFGRISFSFYLLHPLTLIVIWRIPAVLGWFVEIGVPPAVVSLSLWAITTAAVAPLAHASYRHIELPGIGLGRRLTAMWMRVQRSASLDVGQTL